jgi:hypothetical protein
MPYCRLTNRLRLLANKHSMVSANAGDLSGINRLKSFEFGSVAGDILDLGKACDQSNSADQFMGSERLYRTAAECRLAYQRSGIVDHDDMGVNRFLGTQQGWLAPDSDLRFLISGIGIAAGVVYLVKGLNFHFSRYIVVGSIGGVLSGILMFVPFSFAASWAFLGILWSTILLLSGLVGLRKMLQMKGGLKNG